MKELNDIIKYSKEKNYSKWSINMTHSKLIDRQINDKLEEETLNWSLYKPFADKKGLMFSYFEDYISIFVLSFFVKNYKLLCIPSYQRSDSSLEKANLTNHFVHWRYFEKICYDKNLKVTTEFEEFRNIIFQDLSSGKKKSETKYDFENIKSKLDRNYRYKPKAKAYELTNSDHVHQAVICGGNGDVWECNNYVGLTTNFHNSKVMELLSNYEEPKFEEVVDSCDFFIVHFKGEDLGYARILHIYSKNDISEDINFIVKTFPEFQKDFMELNRSCENLVDYEYQLNKLEAKYGC